MLVTDIAEHPMADDDAFRLVGLGDRLDYFPSQLSGGEQQRVAIACAIAKRPDVLLYDHCGTGVRVSVADRSRCVRNGSACDSRPSPAGAWIAALTVILVRDRPAAIIADMSAANQSFHRFTRLLDPYARNPSSNREPRSPSVAPSLSGSRPVLVPDKPHTLDSVS